MKLVHVIQASANVAVWEWKNILHRPIYWFCMIVLPLSITFFFANIMEEGLPTEMPIGLVDLDNSATSRKLMRLLDSFQESHIVAHYSDISQARRAMQQGKIYAFMYIPAGMERDLLASRQPKISYYYNNSILLAGSLLYKDLRVISTLGAAAVGQARMQAQGYTSQQIKAALQPIVTDVHALDNPTLNYNVALSPTIIPACICLFIFLMTCYSFGMELKFSTSRALMRKARGSILIAINGKMFPQTLVFTLIMWAYQYWLFIHMGFPYNCSFFFIMLMGWLLVLASQGLGLFIFCILPSMRMSMSISALWGVLSFSISGFTYPVTAMDPSLQLLSWMFPLRHYFMVYQMSVFHGFPLYYAWPHVVALSVFVLLPVVGLRRIRNVLYNFEYIP